MGCSLNVCNTPIIEPMSTLQMEAGWKKRLEGVFQSPTLQQLRERLINERRQYAVFPPAKHIFAAFDHTTWDAVKVVILGQDPYHGPGQANGLCFSVEPDFRPLPPSLKNIYKELESDLGIKPCEHGDLRSWAEQGVLLLNNVLTVRQGQPQSHQNWGWELVTDMAVTCLSKEKTNLVFLLWGSAARKKAAGVNRERHLVLECAHPSPLSFHRGFKGCRHFSQTNEYLKAHGIAPIDWDPCRS